ncbi:Tn3 family transposase, partial [Citrobacter sp. Cb130]|uniref:Tn3 family transposase n=1 Tax=Citrobacter sp. Cb130 TaxID=2985033 RepID=UPI00336BD9B6
MHYVACIFLVKIQAGLNKGEARNALARAVFMHRLGEIRDRGLENQSYRASGLRGLRSNDVKNHDKKITCCFYLKKAET